MEDFAPQTVDIFGFFNSPQTKVPLSVVDVAVSLSHLATPYSTRAFPLLLAENIVPFNNRLLADLACMMETFVTPTIFPTSNISIPRGMGHLAFGTGQIAAGSENIIPKSTCTMSLYSSRGEFAKCTIDRSLASFAPVYLVDPELDLLR